MSDLSEQFVQWAEGVIDAYQKGIDDLHLTPAQSKEITAKMMGCSLGNVIDEPAAKQAKQSAVPAPYRRK